MALILKSFLDEPTEILRPYRLPPSAQINCEMGLFSSMQIKWNADSVLGYSYPLPDQQSLNDFYSTLYRQVINKRRGIEHYITSPNYRAQTVSQVSWVKDLVDNQGEWLDVGAGFGLLLWTVKQNLPNWKLHAVEPDMEAYNDLREFVEVEKDFPGFWRGQTFDRNRFDVLSISHVLEHLIDPFSSVKTLYHYIRVLKSFWTELLFKSP